jgi:hypothetical protein
MASKFAEFLNENKIDARRVLISSRKLETLRPEDRALRAARAKKGDESEKKKEEEGAEAPAKPRSGRPVTPRLFAAASSGSKGVSGPAKTRLLRAVNRILEQRKQAPVDLRALF